MAPHKLDQVSNKHSDVFEEVILRIMLKLEVDPSVTSRFHKTRSILFALKEKVERELKKLEDQDLLLIQIGQLLLFQLLNRTVMLGSVGIIV